MTGASVLGILPTFGVLRNERKYSLLNTEIIDGVHVVTAYSKDAENSTTISLIDYEMELLINDPAVNEIVLDLSRTETFGSPENTYRESLISKLIEINQKCKDRDKPLCLIVDNKFNDIVKLTRLDSITNVKPNLEAALNTQFNVRKDSTDGVYIVTFVKSHLDDGDMMSGLLRTQLNELEDKEPKAVVMNFGSVKSWTPRNISQISRFRNNISGGEGQETRLFTCNFRPDLSDSLDRTSCLRSEGNNSFSDSLRLARTKA
jgi:hypothetical protein